MKNCSTCNACKRLYRGYWYRYYWNKLFYCTFISKSSGRRVAVFIGREEGMSLISHLNALTK